MASAPHVALRAPWSISAGNAVLTMPNRFVMAPMTRRQATDACEVYDIHAKYYAARAQGGVGLIVTEGVHVNSDTAVDAPNTPQCATPSQVEGWQMVAKAVHDAGSRIAMQLWHTGLLSRNPVGPSVPNPPVSQQTPIALDLVGLQQIAADFATTAVAAIHGAKFDAVEIHGAHGYLLDSFASKPLNRRQDGFGIHTRAAFPVMVVEAVRAAIGPNVPIIYRFSQWTLMNYAEIKFDTSTELAQFLLPLKAAGVNCFHVSTRVATTPGFPSEDPHRTLAGWSRLITELPVIAVGGVGVNHEFKRGANKGDTFANADPSTALHLVASAEVDALAVGRMLLTNKAYCNQVMDGKWAESPPYEPERLGALDW